LRPAMSAALVYNAGIREDRCDRLLTASSMSGCRLQIWKRERRQGVLRPGRLPAAGTGIDRGDDRPGRREAPDGGGIASKADHPAPVLPGRVQNSLDVSASLRSALEEVPLSLMCSTRRRQPVGDRFGRRVTRENTKRSWTRLTWISKTSSS